MHLPFNFFLAQVSSLDARLFAEAIRAVEAACGARWPTLVLSNHDIARACDRYPSRDPDALARVLATMLCTLRGTPFMYYGEEIAMRTVPPASLDEVRDPVGRRFWPHYKGRDGSRRPMQWEPGSAGGGFTTGAPWLPLGPDSASRSVVAQQDAPESVLNTYRTLLHLRRQSPALRSGALRLLDGGPAVLAFAREADDERQVIVLNMSEAEQSIQTADMQGIEGRVRFGTHRPRRASVAVSDARLAPFEAVILQSS
jgi:alpha-glucosidase